MVALAAQHLKCGRGAQQDKNQLAIHHPLETADFRAGRLNDAAPYSGTGTGRIP